MADDEHRTPGLDLGLVQQFISQLRATTERLESLTGFGEHLPTAPGALPLPGALSATQLRSIVDSIAAQRHSIEALKAQLSSFDEQLAALEKILGPFAEWTKTWVELEERLLRMGRGPEPRKLPPGPPGRPGTTRISQKVLGEKVGRLPWRQVRYFSSYTLPPVDGLLISRG